MKRSAIASLGRTEASALLVAHCALSVALVLPARSVCSAAPPDDAFVEVTGRASEVDCDGPCESADAIRLAASGAKYATGEGVPKDPARAAELLGRACDFGHAGACANLAVLYHRGEGVARDDSRASDLLERACQAGNRKGCFNLALMLQDSPCRERAIAAFRRACHRGGYDPACATFIIVRPETGVIWPGPCGPELDPASPTTPATADLVPTETAPRGTHADHPARARQAQSVHPARLPKSRWTMPWEWEGWFTTSAGRAWGDSIGHSGVQGPRGQFQLGLWFAYRFLYVGGGWFTLRFHDASPLRREVVYEDGSTGIEKAVAHTSGGYVEAGWVQRFFLVVPVKAPQPGRTKNGIGLWPMIGYGVEGVTTVGRYLDEETEFVSDYHGGSYLRFQLGMLYTHCQYGARHCLLTGIIPSYQYFLKREAPSMRAYLDIALSIGLTFRSVGPQP